MTFEQSIAEARKIREFGYYQLRDGNEWLVAEWTRHGWFECGNECENPDHDYDEIGEMVIFPGVSEGQQ